MSRRCMSLTGFFHDSDIPEEQGIEVLRKALELGVTTYNTAYFYGVPCSGCSWLDWSTTFAYQGNSKE